MNRGSNTLYLTGCLLLFGFAGVAAKSVDIKENEFVSSFVRDGSDFRLRFLEKDELASLVGKKSLVVCFAYFAVGAEKVYSEKKELIDIRYLYGSTFEITAESVESLINRGVALELSDEKNEVLSEETDLGRLSLLYVSRNRIYKGYYWELKNVLDGIHPEPGDVLFVTGLMP